MGQFERDAASWRFKPLRTRLQHRAAAEPIEFEDDEDITTAQVVQARRQVGTIGRGAGGVILEHGMHDMLLQPFMVTFEFATMPIVNGPCTLDAVLCGEMARTVACLDAAIRATPLALTDGVPPLGRSTSAACFATSTVWRWDSMMTPLTRSRRSVIPTGKPKSTVGPPGGSRWFALTMACLVYVLDAR